jgi:hypothetical protein
VSRSKLNRLLPIGLLTLGAGLLPDISMPGDDAQSVSGFFASNLGGVHLVRILPSEARGCRLKQSRACWASRPERAAEALAPSLSYQHSATILPARGSDQY